jgi:hypothetical protein
MQLARLAPGPGAEAPPPGAQTMQTNLEDMLDFKKRVDRLIDDHLSASPADPQQITQESMPASALGTGFAEATGLHTAYSRVHDELTGLSRLLAGQVNALSTAILAAKNGYESIDLDTREQMLAIQAESEQYYDPERDPYAVEHGRAPENPGQGGAQPTANEGQEKTPSAGDDGAGL